MKDGNLSLHEVMDGEDTVLLLTDADLDVLFVWNGSATFLAYREVGYGSYAECDGWTADVPPRSLVEAKARCRERLAIMRKEVEDSESP